MEGVSRRNSRNSVNMKKRDRFKQLIDRNKRIISHVCILYAGGDGHLVEELRQEIAIALWKSFRGLRSEEAEKSWVYTVSRNTAITYMSKHVWRRHEVLVDVDEMFGYVGCQYEIDEETLLLNDDLVRLMVVLSVSERQLLMYYLEGKNHRQIASVMGLSESAVGTRLSRIYDKLRSMHKQNILKSTGKKR